jgi:hypothetical protein
MRYAYQLAATLFTTTACNRSFLHAAGVIIRTADVKNGIQ